MSGTHARVTRIAGAGWQDLPAALRQEFVDAGLDPDAVLAQVAAAVAEDLPGPDVTSWSTIDPAARATADLAARADGVLAGGALAELVFRYVVGPVEVARPVSDGTRVARGGTVLTVTGPTALLLTAERTALNFLCHLSGVATATARWVDALAGTGARVRDTRKTTPGLRSLEKYAVRCGGGTNHRATLSDQALVKDNHVLAAGGVVPAYRRVVAAYGEVPVQVEVTTLEQLAELLEIGVERILLDNMSTDQLAAAVRMRDSSGVPAALEASGGLVLERAVEVAATGVDFVAVGALTHSAPVWDVGMDLREEQR